VEIWPVCRCARPPATMPIDMSWLGRVRTTLPRGERPRDQVHRLQPQPAETRQLQRHRLFRSSRKPTPAIRSKPRRRWPMLRNRHST